MAGIVFAPASAGSSERRLYAVFESTSLKYKLPERPSESRGSSKRYATASAPVSEPAEPLLSPVPGGVYDREALYVALYGSPGSSVLGAIPSASTVTRPERT